jgi:hypothetical protein
MTRATNVNAAGQEILPEIAHFDIEQRTPRRVEALWRAGRLGAGCFRFTPKKYRPPRPMGVKGGCSPQNTLEKLEP